MSRPDEGIIHAWLDGELDAAEAARVAALVERDPEWAAAAAEARGFLAASSRIVSALDDVPAGVVPKPKAAPVFVKQRHWSRSPRFLATAALAATMLILVQVAPQHVIETPDQLAAVALKDAVVPAGAPPAAPAAVAEAQPSKERDASSARAKQRPYADEVQNAATKALADAPANQGRAGALTERNALSAVQAPVQSQVQAQAAPSLARQQVAATGSGAGGAPADAFRRDAADQRKLNSLVAGKTEDLKKSKLDSTPVAAPPASGVRAEMFARSAAAGAAANEGRRGPQIISMDDSTRYECYRRLPTQPGVDQIERVLRLTDSTVFPLILREEASKAAVNRTLAAAPPAAPPTRPAQLLVKRDTLIIPLSNGVTVRAVRTSCPKP